jgi:hypothetical protein
LRRRLQPSSVARSGADSEIATARGLAITPSHQ